MRYLSMTPTKGLLFASLALLLMADTASAQIFGGRFRNRGNQGYQSYYPPTTSASQQQGYQSNYPPSQSLPATVELTVPADAQIWFNGQPTTLTGTVRRFVTPPLSADSDYSYEIKVKWTRDGQPVEQTKNISVVAGGLRQINLLRPVQAMPEQ